MSRNDPITGEKSIDFHFDIVNSMKKRKEKRGEIISIVFFSFSPCVSKKRKKGKEGEITHRNSRSLGLKLSAILGRLIHPKSKRKKGGFRSDAGRW